jgi:RNA polymerase-associated protein CTR9
MKSVWFCDLLFFWTAAEGVHEGLESMRAAYAISPYCAMALNHVANHFFIMGEHYVVDQLMEAALVATDHSQIKAHSYYNLARSYHTKVVHPFHELLVPISR